jgi:hypothetical protein
MPLSDLSRRQQLQLLSRRSSFDPIFDRTLSDSRFGKEIEMELLRKTLDVFDPYRVGKFLGTTSDDFRGGDQDVVIISFPRFGGGTKRLSDFEVHSSWNDVEKIIAKFIEGKHPEALALKEARALGAAARELGWTPRGSE